VIEADPQGYGQTDYTPTVYTDIDPTTGLPNNAVRMDGALALGGTRVARITDGTSHTIAICEDSPINFETLFPFIVSGNPDPVVAAGNSADPPPPSNSRLINRWAEPDKADGISGAANSTAGNLKSAVNNNNTPLGGPSDCLWTQSGCGTNTEIFSFHPGGAYVLLCDGSVQMLQEQIDPRVVRKLVTRAEGIGVEETEYQ
jgi:prepilin-type processing-associated H-X9-DG protein